ncbi:hypothetical protein WJX73_009935 [Symbiochloris irregularis]|uniref:protein-serine/threonine phosphatase n=1 Tax=Symbiochloris irregularis TaxID=706552 RepID=A0AAW1P768_9CHLO
MGAYLSTPVTTKDSSEGENELFKYGICSMQGWRTEMEDAHCAVLEVEPDNHTGFFGVFDGHGGQEVAKYCSLRMAQELISMPAYQQGRLAEALRDVYLHIDELLSSEALREELTALAGPKEPSGGQRLALQEDDLPDVLREAIQKARNRAAQDVSGEFLDAAGHEDGDGEAQSPSDEDLVETVAEMMEGAEGFIGPPDGAAVAQRGADGTASSSHEDAGPPAGSSAQESKDSGRQSGRKRARKPSNVARRGSGKGAVPRSHTQGPSSESTDGSDGLPEAEGSADPVAAPSGLAQTEAEAAQSSENLNAAMQTTLELEGEEPSPVESSSGSEGSEQPADRQPQRYLGPAAGCTAVVALVRGQQLLVANAGDSRCVACHNGEAVAMTQDHKPTDGPEMARITKAGGFVMEGRVNGSLNLSRAIGDMEYKQARQLTPAEQMVTAMPEVRTLELAPGHEFLLLACDGIWDVLTNQQAVTFVRERLMAGWTPRRVCEALCDHCLAPDTSGDGKGCDNMSAMVVQLKAYQQAGKKEKS